MHKRSKTECFLRYILRRRQCVIILFVQIIILLLLAAFIFIQLQSNANLDEYYHQLSRENAVLAEYENFTNFFSCKYYPPSEYDVSQCGWGTDESSFMVRFHRRRTGTQKCASRFEMIPCDLKYPKSYRKWQKLLRNVISNSANFANEYHPCPGIFKNSIGKYGISPQIPILAPKIKNINQLGEAIALRPKDFIMRCPICMISSSFSSKMRKNYCARSIKTLHEGWPQQVAFCDEVEKHPFENFCNTYDTVMNKMRDISTSVISADNDYHEYND